jgi:hypothetical protein
MSDTGPLPAVPAGGTADDELAGLFGQVIAACEMTAEAAGRAAAGGGGDGWRYCASRLAALEEAIRAAYRLRLVPGAWHGAHEPRHARARGRAPLRIVRGG